MLDIESDYQVFDQKELITFQNQGENPVLIDNVMRRPSMLGFESEGGAMIYSAVIDFKIWKQELPVNFTPKLNALITDNQGKHYYVDSVDDSALRSRWSVKATSRAGEGTN